MDDKANRRAWLQAIDSMKDAAKHLVSITTFLQAVYFAAISFGDLRKVLTGPLTVIFVPPVVLWLAALGLALQVVIPVGRPEPLEDTYTRKRRWLQAANWVLWTSFLALLADIIYYLLFVPPPPACP
jgi:hypothetical protein